MSESSMGIYNPQTLQLGIINLNAASTTNIITFSPTRVNSSDPKSINKYLYKNMVYNRFGAQTSTNTNR